MYPMVGGYGLFLLFSLPALLLGLWAQSKVRSAFNKYSRIRVYTGMRGADIARRILDRNGLTHVKVEETKGMLSDHYDPRSKTLRLSPEVFNGNSIAAAGVAAHEVGHALQDKKGYFPLQVRSAMVPTVQIGSWLGPIIFMVGLFMSSSTGTQIAWIGLLLFGLTALFSVVTLPVEFDATKRAQEWLVTTGSIQVSEMPGVKQILDAAALTYVAAAIQAITTVMYYGFLLMGRNRD